MWWNCLDILVTYTISVDISGSFALDSIPIFPVPAKHFSPHCVRSPSTGLRPFAKYFITIWRSKLADHIQLIDIISDASIENQHLQEEISRNEGTLWTETMYICHYVNPLLHRLLSLPGINQSLPFSFVAEALRLGAIIYLATIRYAFGISPFQSEGPARKIKALFDKLEHTGIEQSAQNLGWGWVKIWVLRCAAMGPDGHWFLDQLHAEMGKFGMKTYDDFEKYSGSFLWIPEVHGLLLRRQ